MGRVLFAIFLVLAAATVAILSRSLHMMGLELPPMRSAPTLFAAPSALSLF
jgi:hypothetical protein